MEIEVNSATDVSMKKFKARDGIKVQMHPAVVQYSCSSSVIYVALFRLEWLYFLNWQTQDHEPGVMQCVRQLFQLF